MVINISDSNIKKECRNCKFGKPDSDFTVFCTICKKVNKRFLATDHCYYWKKGPYVAPVFVEKIRHPDDQKIVREMIFPGPKTTDISIDQRGYVYILTNKAMPNYVKIGKTTNSPELRAAELSYPTGIPLPFQVYYKILVSDCSQVEKEIHDELKEYRTNSDREFFKIAPEIAKKFLNLIVNK